MTEMKPDADGCGGGCCDSTTSSVAESKVDTDAEDYCTGGARCDGNELITKHFAVIFR
jgi:hypothetical protein